MKKFMFLTYGFTPPTPAMMAAWNKWFEEIRPSIVEMAGLRNGREISKAGTSELPLGLESVTGFAIVTAESSEAAERMAQGNPYVTAIRVYELASK
jgi:hypothetical protein